MAEVYYIEGSDYTGKTTLIDNLCKYIKSKGKTVLALKEPNGRYREELLSKDGNLSFFERRILFMACHMQTREYINKHMNEYDYVIVDRNAIISDMMYLETELPAIEEEDAESVKRSLRRMYSSALRTQYCSGCASFEPHLIVLHIDEDEFKTRVNARAVKEDDINDLKDMDFKMSIYNAYKKFIYEDDHFNNMLKSFFASVHVVDNWDYDSRIKARILYDTVMKDGK